MGSSQAIVEDYRKARQESDYPAQTGILISLLRMLLLGEGDSLEVAQSTALAILRVQGET